MKRVNIFIAAVTVILLVIPGVAASAQGSVNSNNEFPASTGGANGTDGAFSSGDITSGISDPATEFDGTDVSGTDGYTDTADTDVMTDRSTEPPVRTDAPTDSLTGDTAEKTDNGAMVAVTVAVVLAAAVLLIVAGILLNRKRKMN